MTKLPTEPNIDSKTRASLARKGAVPVALAAALTSPLAFQSLERLEGNVLAVYADHLANDLPTACAGRTDRTWEVGTKLTSDECQQINKITLIEYGYAVLGCTNWDYLSANRLIGLTMFAVNVGKEGACGSRAVRLINAGDVVQGCEALVTGPDGRPAWSYAGGVFVQGLQNRRKAERKLCLDGYSDV